MSAPQKLDLGGDTTLIVGQDGSKMRVLVDKKLLTGYSQYFKTLFGSDFSEGTAAIHGEDIVLKDDDPKDMALLLEILHRRYDSDMGLTPPELIALGIVADKYECTLALHSFTEFLFAPYPSTSELDCNVMCDLAVAAYLLDLPVHFERYTKSLILESDTPLSSLGLSDNGQLIPVSAWRKYPKPRRPII